MPAPLVLDLDFVRFLLSRSDNFLSRYASLPDVGAWRERCQVALDEWQEIQDATERQAAILAFTHLTFGAGRLPMLRRRYSTHKHRQSRAYTPVDLSTDAMAGLKRVRQEYGLDSYSETVEWLLRELKLAGKG